MISGGALPNSFHSDVMDAYPETEEAKVIFYVLFVVAMLND